MRRRKGKKEMDGGKKRDGQQTERKTFYKSRDREREIAREREREREKAILRQVERRRTDRRIIRPTIARFQFHQLDARSKLQKAGPYLIKFAKCLYL